MQTSRRIRRGALRVAVLIALVVTATATLDLPAPADHRFPDVSDTSSLAPAAAWALDQDIVAGFADGTFGASQVLNRGQVVNWIWAQQGRPAPTGPSPFSDLAPGAYAHDAATWANEADVVGGYPDHTFRPRRTVTRGQVVGWLWRVAGRPQPTAPSPFPDAAAGQLGSAVAWAAEHDVAGGFPDGKFKPSRTVTRGTAVQWLYRASTLPTDPPPNVLVVLTDDQTLASLAVMPQTRALIGTQGTTFTEDIASFPLCCPARATHATGQYAHHHGVVDNDNNPHPTGLPSGPVLGQGGYDEFDHTNTIATWMDSLGYVTSYVGKTLNDYDGALAQPPVPPGYDRWFGWMLQAPTQAQPGLQQYFNYEIYEDPDGAAGPTPGAEVLYGNEDDDYLTDVLRDRALGQMGELAATDDPWFLTFAPYGPHTGTGRTRANGNPLGTAPAPRHLGDLVSAPNLPNWPPQDNPAFDMIPADSAPWVTEARNGPASPWVQVQTQGTPEPDDDLTDEELQTLIRSGYRLYLESLLAVDEAVQALVQQLTTLGELENTLIIFTSDNGYAYGEHGFLSEKNEPYEESLRVPLLVRGPGFPAGATVSVPTADIDYAPTLVRATGATPGLVMDGLALQDVASNPDGYDDRAILIQNWPTSTRPLNRIRHWEGVRTARYTYLEVPETSSIELYDRSIDPHQLESVHLDPAYDAIEAYFNGLLDELKACAGVTCDIRAHPPEPTTP